MSWNVCPRCGFNKWYDPGEGSLCVTCVERGHGSPEPAGPLVEYDFTGARSLNSQAIRDLVNDRRAFELAFPDLIEVEFRHEEGP